MKRSAVIRGYINLLNDVKEKIINKSVDITDGLLDSLEAVGVNLNGYRKAKSNKVYVYSNKDSK